MHADASISKKADWTLRPARKGDVPTLIEMALTVPDPALLFAPCVQTSAPASLVSRLLSLPFGPLGYRNVSVLEIDGRAVAFVVSLTLDEVEGFVGPVLPIDVAASRYGDDLGSIDIIDLIAVAADFRGRRLASRLFRWSIDQARRRGQKFYVGHCWERNESSLRAFRRYGFQPIYDGLFPFAGGEESRYRIFDYDCRQSMENQA